MRAIIFDCFGVLSIGGEPDEALLDFIRDDLKPEFKIGMLSNAVSNMIGDLFEPWQAELFDTVVLSYETGSMKPDPEIYQLVADKLGVSTDECIFVDDIEQFCDAAEAVGMKSVWHTETQTTIMKIKELIHA